DNAIAALLDELTKQEFRPSRNACENDLRSCMTVSIKSAIPVSVEVRKSEYIKNLFLLFSFFWYKGFVYQNRLTKRKGDTQERCQP
ncbi:MAG: hypothetical protein ACD_17C00280G0001, partial [uncultured bacterium]